MSSRQTNKALLLEHSPATGWEEAGEIVKAHTLDERPPRFYSPEEDVVRLVALEAAGRRSANLRAETRSDSSRWSRFCFEARELLAFSL